MKKKKIHISDLGLKKLYAATKVLNCQLLQMITNSAISTYDSFGGISMWICIIFRGLSSYANSLSKTCVMYGSEIKTITTN